jgi:hypothetical protein
VPELEVLLTRVESSEACFDLAMALWWITARLTT